MTPVLLVPDAVLIGTEIKPGLGLLIDNGAIAAIDSAERLTEQRPQAKRIDLAQQLVMPGLVNAHQHGRGISSLQLGFADDMLETWIAAKRGRAALDPYPITLLACARMIASGVTATIQANSAYGSGDYERELRVTLDAYDKAGLRVMLGVGAMDRAELVYPDEAQHEFIAGLPESLQALVQLGDSGYAGDASQTIALMERLRADYAERPLLSFCYAPAGPQWVSDAMFEALAAHANGNNLALHLHGLESYSQLETLQTLYPEGFLARLESLGALSARTSIAHGVWLSEADLARARKHDVTIVRNPGSNLRLRAGIAPLASYLQRGARVALGSDNTTLNDDEDLFTELRLAARLARSPHWDGPPPPTSEQLLAMLTVNGAHAMGLADSIGAIKVGARADLIALDLKRLRGAYRDPRLPLLDVLFMRAKAADVRMTMVDGRILYRDGVFPHLDLALIEQQAASAADASRARSSSSAEQGELVAQLVERIGEFYRQQRRLRQQAEEQTEGRLRWRPLAEEQGWS